MAPPFRKAEFKIYYDGRKIDPADELADVAVTKGLIGRYDAAGNPSPTGRTYLWPSEPAFKASKKADVAVELRKFPKVQEEILEMIRNGVMPDQAIASHEMDSEMSDEEFERKMREEAEQIKNGVVSDAEEVSTEWDDI